MVLDVLSRSPFGSLHQLDLKLLSVNTLLVVTTVKHFSYTLSFNPAYAQFYPGNTNVVFKTL